MLFHLEQALMNAWRTQHRVFAHGSGKIVMASRTPSGHGGTINMGSFQLTVVPLPIAGFAVDVFLPGFVSTCDLDPTPYIIQSVRPEWCFFQS